MKTRKFKHGNLEVSAIGFGCMGLSHGYGAVPEKVESIRLIRRAYESGCTFFDTAEGYANGENEELVGEALKPIRDKVIIATKFASFSDLRDGKVIPKRFTPQQIREHLEASLRRLHTDYIDLYFQHRVCPDNVEEVAYCMGELIGEGKIRGWGQVYGRSDSSGTYHNATCSHTKRIFDDGTDV